MASKGTRFRRENVRREEKGGKKLHDPRGEELDSPSDIEGRGEGLEESWVKGRRRFPCWGGVNAIRGKKKGKDGFLWEKRKRRGRLVERA